MSESPNQAEQYLLDLDQSTPQGIRIGLRDCADVAGGDEEVGDEEVLELGHALIGARAAFPSHLFIARTIAVAPPNKFRCEQQANPAYSSVLLFCGCRCAPRSIPRLMLLRTPIEASVWV